MRTRPASSVNRAPADTRGVAIGGWATSVTPLRVDGVAGSRSGQDVEPLRQRDELTGWLAALGAYPAQAQLPAQEVVAHLLGRQPLGVQQHGLGLVEAVALAV